MLFGTFTISAVKALQDLSDLGLYKNGKKSATLPNITAILNKNGVQIQEIPSDPVRFWKSAFFCMVAVFSQQSVFWCQYKTESCHFSTCADNRSKFMSNLNTVMLLLIIKSQIYFNYDENLQSTITINWIADLLVMHIIICLSLLTSLVQYIYVFLNCYNTIKTSNYSS